MKFIYPAVFKKTENGTYHGYFPDLESCYGDGDTLDEAIENANAAAYDWITLELAEEEPAMPPISDESDLDLEEGEIVFFYLARPVIWMLNSYRSPTSLLSTYSKGPFSV